MSGEVGRALVVEDERSWQAILAELLGDIGLAVDLSSSLEEAVQFLKSTHHRVAVVDLSLGTGSPFNRDGLAVLEAVRRHDPGCAALLLTGYATVELAVAAMHDYGAYTALRKESFRRSHFREVIRQALALAPAPAASAGQEPDKLRPLSGREETAAPGALLVEDDAGWRDILTELLSEAGFRPRAALSYGEALGYLRREPFAVAVVDLSLANSLTPQGNRDGYQVLQAAAVAGTPAIVVSGVATSNDVERSYAEYGAFAWLEKQAFNRRAFVAVVREAAERGSVPAVETPARRSTAPALLPALTPREADVLRLLAGGLTNKEIAAELALSPNTVKRYLKSIFEKLGVETRSAAAARAVGAGL